MTRHVPDEQFMRRAITLARDSRLAGDYAIGAVVVREGNVLGASGNRVKLDHDATQHAEIAAIRAASKLLGTRHLDRAVLYTTAEPCPMCAGAAVMARMAGIVSGSTISDMADFRRRFGSPDWSWRTLEIAARSILDSADPKLFLIEAFLREECVTLFHSDRLPLK